jgi:hypothetical protein
MYAVDPCAPDSLRNPIASATRTGLSDTVNALHGGLPGKEAAALQH